MRIIKNLLHKKEKAVQIVSVGSQNDRDSFTFHKETLDSILEKIPENTKVSVISVVGNFRTGKSFLLSCFLRYLTHREETSASTTASVWHDETTSLSQDGFHWRGGSERDTIGVWMWSKPFYLPSSDINGNGEKIAVLLVDTQGMFDNETTMGLTSRIFGLSTLMSSYQIYNVSQRIGGDNLQHLALFSEYGRVAANAAASTDTDDDTTTNETNNGNNHRKPFQKMEFLVRDWANFEDGEDIEACEAAMRTYLEQEVLAAPSDTNNLSAESVAPSGGTNDLSDTREQIRACFEDISCFLMTHPGLAVTNKNYMGGTDEVDSLFKRFMDRYCERVFGNVVAKSIHGNELTALELGVHIEKFAELFEKDTGYFPEAATMLKAISTANNINASRSSVKLFKELMDKRVGPDVETYVSPEVLGEYGAKVRSQCLKLFDERAHFGDGKAIESTRVELENDLEEQHKVYIKLNDSRKPMNGALKTYDTLIFLLFIIIIDLLPSHLHHVISPPLIQIAQGHKHS